jgi:hypothetical protein
LRVNVSVALTPLLPRRDEAPLLFNGAVRAAANAVDEAESNNVLSDGSRRRLPGSEFYRDEPAREESLGCWRTSRAGFLREPHEQYGEKHAETATES